MSASTITPIGRLILLLAEHLNGRGLALYSQELPSGVRKEFRPAVHFWTVNGKPLLIQETREGGYDLFIPLLDSISIKETERAVRAYATQKPFTLPEVSIEALRHAIGALTFAGVPCPSCRQVVALLSALHDRAQIAQDARSSATPIESGGRAGERSESAPSAPGTPVGGANPGSASGEQGDPPASVPVEPADRPWDARE